jgi:hypothetical protein
MMKGEESTVKWNEGRKEKKKSSTTTFTRHHYSLSYTTPPSSLLKVLDWRQARNTVKFSGEVMKRWHGGKEQPSFPPAVQQDPQWAWYRLKTDDGKGGNSLKWPSFLLKCLFPRHCEEDCYSPFARTKHTCGNRSISNTTPSTFLQLVLSLKSLFNLNNAPWICLVLGGADFVFCKIGNHL